jgi:hypothetical protein
LIENTIGNIYTEHHIDINQNTIKNPDKFTIRVLFEYSEYSGLLYVGLNPKIELT